MSQTESPLMKSKAGLESPSSAELFARLWISREDACSQPFRKALPTSRTLQRMRLEPLRYRRRHHREERIGRRRAYAPGDQSDGSGDKDVEAPDFSQILVRKREGPACTNTPRSGVKES